ncbi:hypothetical protein WMF31_21780 [Sorangium sp. So ce1036]|uniref:hypothetical protein n=1 Tax=Sorangium sp. So ce1036 TaxID=3133328 RepID=UPI003F07A527
MLVSISHAAGPDARPDPGPAQQEGGRRRSTPRSQATPRSPGRAALRAACRALSLLAASALCAFGAGCNGTYGAHAGQAMTPSPATWQSVTIPDHGFSVRMPMQPEVERETEIADDGGVMGVFFGANVLRDVVLGFRIVHDPVGFTGHPIKGGALVDLIAEDPPGRAPADTSEVVSRREFMSGGLQGRDVALVDRQRGTMMHVRLLLGRQRLFGAFAIHAIEEQARLAPIVAAYLGSVAVTPAEATSPVGSGKLDLARWEHVCPPEADFVAVMPGSVRHEEVTLPLAEETYQVNVYSVTTDVESYRVYEVRVGEAPKMKLVEHLRASLLAGGARVREERDVQSRGYAGRSIVVEHGDYLIHTRLFLTAGRVYDVRATVPLRREAASKPHIDRFFEHFKIL